MSIPLNDPYSSEPRIIVPQDYSSITAATSRPDLRTAGGILMNAQTVNADSEAKVDRA
jgi:hypothetical protein